VAVNIDQLSSQYVCNQEEVDRSELSRKNVMGCDKKIAFKPRSHPQLPVGTNCTFLTLVPGLFRSFLRGCTWTGSISYTSRTDSHQLLSVFAD